VTSSVITYLSLWLHQPGRHQQARNQARSGVPAHKVGLGLHAAVGVEDDRELVAYIDLLYHRSLLDAQIVRHRLADRILRRREPTQIDRRRAQRLVAKPPLNFTRLHAAFFQFLGEGMADLVNG